jgi:aldehyde dehydrogenase (NAD+)
MKLQELDKLLSRQREAFRTIRREKAEFRIQRLKSLKSVLEKYRPKILQALAEDLGKPEAEAQLMEITPTLAEIDMAIKNVKSWMKSKSVLTPLALLGSRSEIRYHPRGQVLIMAPWNYPFQLAIMPLVGSIAAGNVSVVKPSEVSEATAEVIGQIINEAFDPEEVLCVPGDVQYATRLLKYDFDHIFFTGSIPVGKVVMEAASKNLTSVTLELGGKSPAIIDRKTNLKMVANRIAWGKFINAGQTCVAPDYIIVPDEMKDEFIKHLNESLNRFYGEEGKRESSPDYCRIINQRHFERLSNLLDTAVEDGAEVAVGGEKNEKTKYFSPTVLTGLKESMKIMGEEIFGPILPVLTYYQTEEIFDIVEKNKNPLALYVFSNNQKFIDEVLDNALAGGTCINDCIIHLGNPNLPFGGVGPSGMGKYHGEYSFAEFSYARPVLHQNPIFGTVEVAYPPYNPLKNTVAEIMKDLL